MIINNISIRKAKRTDLSDVFLWRNDRCSRDNFFNQEPIEFTSHAKWYQRALVDPDMFLFIGLLESDLSPVILVSKFCAANKPVSNLALVPELPR